MNFDFSWFTTIEGMLITGGVLLLLLALIILIVTTSKKKKEEAALTENVDNNINNQSVTSQVIDNQPLPVTPEPVNNGMGLPEVNTQTVNMNDSIMNVPDPIAVETNEPVVQDINVQTPSVEMPVSPEVSAEPSMDIPTPTVEPVVESPIVMPETPQNIQPAFEQPPVVPAMETPEVVPSIEMPVIEQNEMPAIETPEVVMPTVVEPAMPTIQPVAPAVETMTVPDIPVVQPTTEIPTVDTITPVEQTPVVESPVVKPVQAEPVIYGGASPVVPDISINTNEQPHQIYGGANPLENTQSIPISNIAGPRAVNPVQTPTVEPTLITPQVEPVQIQNIQQ